MTNYFTIRQIMQRARELIVSKREPLLLFGLWFFHTVNNYIWLCQNNCYLAFDAHSIFLTSLKIFRILKHSPLLNKIGNLIAFLKVDNDWHGFFAQLVTAPFYFIFGTSQNAGVMISGSIFLWILIYSVYGITSKLSGKKAGLLAAFIVSMYPYVFTHSRIYMLDLPLTAMVALAVYLLLITGGFQNRKFSLLFGLAMGLGLLTKFNFAAFIIGPLGCIMYESFININSEAKKRRAFYINFSLSILIAGLLFSLYLIPRWPLLCKKLSKVFVGGGGGVERENFSYLFQAKGALVYILTLLHPLIWHIQVLINRVISFPFSLAFVIGGWAYYRLKIKFFLLFLTWIVVPFFLLLSYSVYQDRLMMPFLPAMAIITSIGIANIAKKKVRGILIVGVLVAGLIQYFAISYGIEALPKRIKMYLPQFAMVKGKYEEMSLVKDILVFDQRKKHFGEFRSSKISKSMLADEVLQPIISSIGKEALKEGISTRPNDMPIRNEILFLGYAPYIYEPLDYEVFIRELAVNIVDPFEKRPILTADYIVTKDGGEDFKKSLRAKRRDDFFKTVKKRKAFLSDNIDKFDLINQIKLDDSSILSIYRNKTRQAVRSKGQPE